MAKGKEKSVFYCKECGYESAKWMGQCPGCRQWNTMSEERITVSSKGSAARAERKETVLSKMSEISTAKEERVATGMKELDRVMGGGIVPGSLTLVGGDPGIGKSTILLQTCRF
ncbi:MAG: DNA repair protein RadA, partial [Lachnospiraceae bacterium]|nr:DNA repair protein RadA [Lachnospiraceae bacterium]